MINPAIFRAYDIRGDSDKDLSSLVAYKIGYCFAKNVICNENNLICVGRDGRLSSKRLCNALLQGLYDGGGKIKFIGLVPTPTLYFADKIFSPSGSIMITGSHNPKDDNGFKMIKAGSPFFGKLIQELRLEIENVVLELPDSKVNLDNISDIKEQYIERILLGRSFNKNMRIAFDPSNGAAGELIQMLCDKLSCQTFLINEKIDGNFPAHDPDPTVAKNLDQLRDFVLANNCDIGIGFDGDADRIGVVTKNGRFVFGDQLLCIYAKDIISKHPNAKIIADVKASGAFFDYVEKIGGIPIMWKTGHSFIKAKMKETGAKLAGEMSGHIFFSDDYYGYDDAIYAALRLIDIISNANSSLDEMIDNLPQVFNTTEMKIKVSDDKKFDIIENIKLEAKDKNWDFIDIDGLRVNTKYGWWLLRASNTGPAIVGRCESNTKEGLDKLNDNLEKILKRYIF